MAITNVTSPVERRSLKEDTAHHYFIPASYRAFKILHFGFVLAPLVAGLDKFFNVLVPWAQYLSPKVVAVTGLPAETFMYGVGFVEILASVIVAFKPRIGGLIVAVWLWGIIINLLSIPAYFDIGLRDFGLSLGALALSRLAVEFEYYRRQPAKARRTWERSKTTA